MTIREAIDLIVSHGRSTRHSERPPRIVAADRIFAKESGVGQSGARGIGSLESL